MVKGKDSEARENDLDEASRNELGAGARSGDARSFTGTKTARELAQGPPNRKQKIAFIRLSWRWVSAGAIYGLMGNSDS